MDGGKRGRGGREMKGSYSYKAWVGAQLPGE